jgi:REP element-mobilizing transposase RayT
MGRRARNQILYDGCFAHVLSKSFEERRSFEEDPDFEAFEGFLLQTKKRYEFFLHHYCLMHTHFHLVVSIPRIDQFSRGLQQLKWRYTDWFNKRHGRTGPLWRERFKSLLIENERYLYACGLYVEENPLKAGIVGKTEDWPHSSSAHYQGVRSDPLVDPYERKEIPEGLDLRNEDFFTKGWGIGSELFQIQLRERSFGGLSVP